MTLNDIYQLLGMKEAELHATRLERDKLRAELAELKNKTIEKQTEDKKS
ncbi:MAG: hypothetical protein KAI17_09420 [Thiotrichaceae bacterium]|nr:hypothetical protein [Thiotrichaceae bacterium]